MASTRIKGITIKIGADTTELTKALRQFEKQINSSKTSLRDINKLLKGDPKNTELLTQKQKALTDAIDGTKKKLEQEKEALKQLEGAEQTDEVVKQQDALKREIIYTEQELKKLEQEYKDFGSVAKQQTIAAGEAMQQAGEKIKGIGEGLTNAGKTMTKYVTAPIVAAGTAAVKTAADFDSGMSKVQAISGANAEQMELLRQKAREMGATTKFSASESAEALSYMAMAGWKTEEMLNGLEGIMYLAAASGEELGTTSDIVTDALTAFGLQAKDSARFADILAAAATNSNTNVSMLGQSFKYAAAPAGTLGYSAEDVALALGLMANNGIKADMAGTSLRNLFNRMAKPTKESQAAIDQLGLSLYDSEGKMYSFREVMQQIRGGFNNVKMSAEDFDKAVEQLDNDLSEGNITQKKYDAEMDALIQNAFGAEEAEKARAAAMLGGTRAMSGLLAIANASEEDFNKLAQAIDTSSNSFAKLADGSIVPLEEALASGAEIIEQYNGQAQAMAAIMEDNLNGDITRLKSQLQELAISFGELLIPEVRDFIASLQGLVDKLNAMNDEDKQAIINAAKVLAAIGPILLIVGKLTIGVGQLVWAIGKIKVALAGAGIASSAAEGSAAVTALGGSIAGLLGPIAAVVAAIAVWVHNWDEIIEAAGLLKERLIEDWELIKEAAAALKEYVIARWDEIKEDWRQKWEFIKEVAKTAWEIIKLLFEEKTEFIRGVIDGGFGFIVDTVQDKMQTVYDIITGIFTDTEGFVQGIIDKAKQWGTDLINNIKAGIEGGREGVRMGVEMVGNEIRSRLHFSSPDVGPLADFNSWMPDMMKQMADQINAGVPGVASAMQNVAGTMAGQLGPDYTGQLASINNGIGKLATANGNITIPVYIGQNKFAQAVVSANQVNNYRNGGR